MTTIATPVDADGVVDLDPAFGLVSGRLALAQAIARRITTRAGLLARIGDDPAYGIDVRESLGADTDTDTDDRTAFAIAAEVQAEVMLDERVRGADVSAALADGVVILTILLADAIGPFRLVLAVSAVTVEILRSV